jgi:hypothetical protein
MPALSMVITCRYQDLLWLSSCVIRLATIKDQKLCANSCSGSMADVPKDLVEEIKKLEEQFTIPTAKLKAITEHFVSELAKGITHRSVAHNLMLIFYKA